MTNLEVLERPIGPPDELLRPARESAMLTLCEQLPQAAGVEAPVIQLPRDLQLRGYQNRLENVVAGECESVTTTDEKVDIAVSRLLAESDNRRKFYKRVFGIGKTSLTEIDINLSIPELYSPTVIREKCKETLAHTPGSEPDELIPSLCGVAVVYQLASEEVFIDRVANSRRPFFKRAFRWIILAD